MTNTLVRGIILNDKKSAIVVEIVDREKYMPNTNAQNQVIISAGAYRTPQVLMLSGIGPSEQLSKHGIPVLVDLPEVDHDHLLMFRCWKLRKPERGLSLGSPLFNGPNYEKGGPVDWIVTSPIDARTLKEAMEHDEGPVPDDHPLLQNRNQLDTNLLYAVFGSEAQGLSIPLDGWYSWDYSQLHTCYLAPKFVPMRRVHGGSRKPNKPVCQCLVVLVFVRERCRHNNFLGRNYSNISLVSASMNRNNRQAPI